MRKLSEILELAMPRYQKCSFMCLAIMGLEKEEIITLEEYYRTIVWIDRRLKGRATLIGHFKHNLGFDYHEISQSLLTKWWQGRIHDLKRRGR